MCATWKQSQRIGIAIPGDRYHGGRDLSTRYVFIIETIALEARLESFGIIEERSVEIASLFIVFSCSNITLSTLSSVSLSQFL